MARTSRTVARDRRPAKPEAWDLLSAATRITGKVDRNRLDAELISAFAELWPLDAVSVYQLVDGQPPMCRRLAAFAEGHLEQRTSFMADNDEPLSCVPGAAAALERRATALESSAGGAVATFPIWNPHHQATRVVVVEGPEAVVADAPAAMEALLHLYQNHLNLIEDSELDSLTGLRNRRTFEHLLLNLLSGEQAPVQSATGFRRASEARDAGNWLAVLDIDRFKSINDKYGHLFGDEVLILVANLMHKSFRAHDPLFRFGGEEFVIVLCGVDRPGAEAAVERFRRNLEAQDFPQVGRITISAGYTEIAAGELSSEILNRADAALYYAKANGRNRTCCYEKLVDEGSISPLTRSAGGGFELF